MTERGAPFSSAGLQKLVQRAGDKAGFEHKVHPHQLRHACTYALTNAGHDLKALQNYLGHRGAKGGSVYRLCCTRISCRWPTRSCSSFRYRSLEPSSLLNSCLRISTRSCSGGMMAFSFAIPRPRRLMRARPNPRRPANWASSNTRLDWRARANSARRTRSRNRSAISPRRNSSNGWPCATALPKPDSTAMRRSSGRTRTGPAFQRCAAAPRPGCGRSGAIRRRCAVSSAGNRQVRLVALRSRAC